MKQKMFSFFQIKISILYQYIQNDPLVCFDSAIYIFNVSNLLFLFNLIFLLGSIGAILNKHNLLLTMLFVEVMYVGIFGYFIISSIILNSPIGQIYAVLLLIFVACESAIGLGILIILYNKEQKVNFDNFTELRG